MGFFRAMPLTLKMMVISATTGILAWLALDLLHNRVTDSVLLEYTQVTLEQHARSDRHQLEQIVKGFHQSLQVMIRQQEFMGYIERVANAEWQNGQPVHVALHHHPPAWFPSNSVVRTFLPTRHAILLDGENRVREVYQHLRQTPSSLLPPSPLLLQLSRGDTFMTYLDEGIPHILTSEIIRRRSGRVLATVIFATPVDDQFLTSLQAKRGYGKGALVLFDGQEDPEVLTSSDVVAVPIGATLSALQDRFFTSFPGVFDYGSSDLLIQLATLMDKKEAMETMVGLAPGQRQLWLFVSGLPLLALLLGVAWLTRRVVLLQRRLAVTIAATDQGWVNPQIPGDQLVWLDDQFHLLLGHARTSQETLQEKSSALVTQQATLTAILESVDDGLIILNERGVVVSLNPAAQRMFGWPAQEMVGHSLHRMMGDSLWERHVKSLTHYVPSAPSKVVGGHIEVTALRADGSSFPLDLRVSQLTLTTGHRFIGVLQDLTEQKQLAMAARLRESDRLFREILELVPLAVVIFNPMGRVTFCNDYFLQITGWSREEVLGVVWWDHFLPMNQQEIAKRFFGHTATSADGSFNDHAFESEVVAKGGGLRLLLWHGVLLRDMDQSLLHHAMIGEDITWRRKIEQEASQARQEAIQANRSRNLYLSRLNHEIRSPLSAMAGFVDLLLHDQDKLSGEMAEYLQHISASSLNVVELLNNVLDYARMDEGRVGLLPEELSPRLLVQGAFHLHKPEAQQKKLVYTYHLGEELPNLIHSERYLLNRILMGLLDHAINAAPQGGKVVLDAHCEGSWLCLGVEDNGPHIHPELGEKVFEPFHDRDTSGRFAVPSLALPLVKQAVEKLQGVIRHKNLRHRGVAFTVRIPMQEEIKKESTTEITGFAPGQRVLVVMEDGLLQQAMAGLLRQMGLEPLLADNLEEAVLLPGLGGADLLLLEDAGGHMAKGLQGPFADLGLLPRILLQDEPHPAPPLPAEAETLVGVVVKPVDRKKLGELLARVLRVGDNQGVELTPPAIPDQVVQEVRTLLEDLASAPLYRADRIVALSRETKKRTLAFHSSLPAICDAIVDAIYTRNSSRVPDLVVEARTLLETEYGHDSGGG